LSKKRNRTPPAAIKSDGNRRSGDETNLMARRSQPVSRFLSAALLYPLVAALAWASVVDVGFATLSPSVRQWRTLLVINKVLERSHYRGPSHCDEFAETEAQRSPTRSGANG